MVDKILVAIDGSEQAWRAQDLASDIAKIYSAELTILHVIPYEPLPEELREYARIEGIPMDEENARYHYSRTLGDKLTEDAEQRARKKGLVRVSCLVAEGNPAEVILSAAADVDMVFLGSRGMSDAKGLLMGSVSHKVANLATRTCVTVK
jgi:nucleotide-binding universal stress UspA family protein